MGVWNNQKQIIEGKKSRFETTGNSNKVRISRLIKIILSSLENETF